VELEKITECEDNSQHADGNGDNQANEEEEHGSKVQQAAKDQETEHLPEVTKNNAVRMANGSKYANRQQGVGVVVELDVDQRSERESDKEINAWDDKAQESYASDDFQDDDDEQQGEIQLESLHEMAGRKSPSAISLTNNMRPSNEGAKVQRPHEEVQAYEDQRKR